MTIYIKGMGNISPQKTWDENGLLNDPLYLNGNRLVCVEPDYASLIDAKQIRRMSRVIKMGVASAIMAMKQAAVDMPDGIITGTGYGCQDDTATFLSKMVENNEVALNPTPFIQSTHNTIGSQIALLIKCQAYNQTYAHGSFSFESALLDAIIQLSESTLKKNLLVGAVDESIDISHRVLSRLGVLRESGPNTIDMFQGTHRGILNGEGAAFFILCNQRDANAQAILHGISTLYRPTKDEVVKQLAQFLKEHNIAPTEIDVVLLGKSGDTEEDSILQDISNQVFSSATKAAFKHLSGEYPVAVSFGLWLSVRLLQEKQIPNHVVLDNKGRTPKNILILNQYFSTHYSMILLSSC